MNIVSDRGLLVIIYVISIVALLLLQRKNPREAQTSFMFNQFLTWILGLLVVEAGWIEYPVREFQIATHTSFGFEYLISPVVSSYFNLYYPKRSGRWIRLGYYLAFTLGITVPEYFIEKHTQLISYLHWKWYWSFISIWLLLFISHQFYLWFFAYRKNFRAAK